MEHFGRSCSRFRPHHQSMLFGFVCSLYLAKRKGSRAAAFLQGCAHGTPCFYIPTCGGMGGLNYNQAQTESLLIGFGLYSHTFRFVLLRVSQVFGLEMQFKAVSGLMLAVLVSYILFPTGRTCEHKVLFRINISLLEICNLV